MLIPAIVPTFSALIIYKNTNYCSGNLVLCEHILYIFKSANVWEDQKYKRNVPN